MEKIFGQQDCAFRLKMYSHGSLVCNIDRCMECNDGEWKEKTDWVSPQSGVEVSVIAERDYQSHDRSVEG